MLGTLTHVELSGTLFANRSFAREETIADFSVGLIGSIGLISSPFAQVPDAHHDQPEPPEFDDEHIEQYRQALGECFDCDRGEVRQGCRFRRHVTISVAEGTA